MGADRCRRDRGDRGVTVIPYRWGDEGAVSLSPVSLETVDGLERLVLPSPNGSTICAVLAETGR